MPAYTYNSIRSKKEFDAIYKKGRVLHGIFFSLRFLENKKDIRDLKFGIILGLNISKSSVERNRKRRQIREIVRINQNKLKKGYLVLISPKEKILQADYKDIEKEFLGICKKAGILR